MFTWLPAHCEQYNNGLSGSPLLSPSFDYGSPRWPRRRHSSGYNPLFHVSIADSEDDDYLLTWWYVACLASFVMSCYIYFTPPA